MHWNVAPDALPRSARLVLVLDHWLNTWVLIIRMDGTDSGNKHVCWYVGTFHFCPSVPMVQMDRTYVKPNATILRHPLILKLCITYYHFTYGHFYVRMYVHSKVHMHSLAAVKGHK